MPDEQILTGEWECDRCHRSVSVPKRVKQANGSVRILGTWCAWRERKDAENAERRAAVSG